jgi:hypothetical protein
MKGDKSEGYFSNDHLRVMFTTKEGSGGAKMQTLNPSSYSLMAAAKNTLVDSRAKLESFDLFYFRLFDDMTTRNGRMPARRPKIVPHCLTVIWYFERLREEFESQYNNDLANSKTKSMSKSTAELLRQLLVCMLSGGYMSIARSTEAEFLEKGDYKFNSGGKLVSSNPAAFKCTLETCKAKSKCQGNCVILDDDDNRCYVRISHWKSGRGDDTHQHNVLMPAVMSKLMRLWLHVGRDIHMKNKKEHFMLFCSSTGVRLTTRTTLNQARVTLRTAGVNIEDWGELSNVRDIRRLFLTRNGDGGIAAHMNTSVIAEQRERGQVQTGIQGDATDDNLQAAWKSITISARTSENKILNNYTSTVEVHAHQCELLELVRKHELDKFISKDTPPIKTVFGIIPGQLFVKENGTASMDTEVENRPLKKIRP